MTETHIDPFAPADSPQHPANWTGQLPKADMPLPGWWEYTGDTDPSGDLDEAPGHEYPRLLTEVGTEQERDNYVAKNMDHWTHDDMPTLADLRERAAQEPPAGPDDDELAKALADLDKL